MKWIALLVLLCSCAAEHEDQGKPRWSYEGDTGPEHWAKLDPAYALAVNGKSQSPVDLVAAQAGDAGQIEFHYAETAYQLVNNGHSIQVNVEEGSWFLLDGKRFDLKQFHFHAPSEHTINGVPSAMEVHLVHQDDKGGLAVVGLLVEAGISSPTLGKIFECAPEVGGEVTIPDLRRDLNVLLPDDLNSFYRYSGSLTTPPCTEGVEWIVMRTPGTASAEQIEMFRKHYSGNRRPVQPLNGRVISVR